MKYLVIAVLTSLSLNGYALGLIPDVVTLSSLPDKVVETAAWSFRTSSYAKVTTVATEANTDLQFIVDPEATTPRDYFASHLTADDFSFVKDLGEMNCTDIKSSYTSGRNTNPLWWLGLSTVGPDSDNFGLISVRNVEDVAVNHCFLLYKSDSKGRVVVLFHVTEWILHSSVKLDQIIILDNSKMIPQIAEVVN